MVKEYENGTLVDWQAYWQGIAMYSKKKTLPVPLRPPQRAHAPALNNALGPETAKGHGGKQ